MIMKRSGCLEFLRFIAAISIVVLHFEWICIGQPRFFRHLYVYVEFFFIISGFFLAMNATENINLNAIKYTMIQFKKLYPLYAVAFVMSFIVDRILSSCSVAEMIKSLWDAKWELILVYIFNFDNVNSYNGGGAAAYIPVLLISTLPLFYIIQNKKEMFKAFAPMLIIINLSYIIRMNGYLSVWNETKFIIPMGLIRGLTEMTFGAICYLIVFPYIKSLKKVYIYFLFTISVVSCTLLILLQNSIKNQDLVIWILIFGIMIMTSMLIDIPEKINSFFCILGRMSYPLFLFHYPVLVLVNKIFCEEKYLLKMIYVFVGLVVVILVINIVRLAGLLFKRKIKVKLFN